MNKKADELPRLARNILKKAGASPVMAEAAAKYLVHAEGHGLPTHVERVETVITTMLADDLLAKIEKLASA